MHTLSHHRLKHHSSKKPPAWLDKLILVVAVVGPLGTLPQIHQIWTTQNASGVSVLTWGLFNLSALLWLIYSYTINNKPLIINSLLWFVLQTMVVIGAIIY